MIYSPGEITRALGEEVKFTIFDPDWSYTLSVFYIQSTTTTLWLQEKKLYCLEVLEGKTNRRHEHEHQSRDEGQCDLLNSFTFVSEIHHIHLVTMLNMPCWDNGMSARTESIPNLWFSSVLRAVLPCRWCELYWCTRVLKLAHQDAPEQDF